MGLLGLERDRVSEDGWLISAAIISKVREALQQL